MLVSLSGVDGSGKSTQIAMLAGHLAEQGVRARTLWFRPGYSRELDALRAMVRRMVPRALPTVAEPQRRESAFARPEVRGAWITMATLDAFLHYAVKLRLHLASGRAVLCDRYWEDGLLDLDLVFSTQRVSDRWVFGALGTCLPRPDVPILLMLPEEVMHKRLAAKREPFPDPPELRATRYRRYLQLARSGRYTVIDGDRSPEVVQRDVREAVAPWLERSSRRS